MFYVNLPHLLHLLKIFFVNVRAFCTFTSNMPLKEKHFWLSIKLSSPTLVILGGTIELVSLKCYKKNYENLLEIFEGVIDQPVGWDDESQDKLSGLLHYLNSFLFCFLVCVFYKILELSSILYSILQDKQTDFNYGVTRIERFKTFVSSLRSNEEFAKFYQEAVDKVGPPATKADKKHNYKQLYFEVLDSIVGMLSERFQDMKRFEFLDLASPKASQIGRGQYQLRKSTSSKKCMVPYLMSNAWEPTFIYLQGYWLP